jgi:hypothetical protein
MPKAERRRLSKVVHDHKGNATVQWYDAPADYERQAFEIEETKPAAKGLNTGSLSIEGVEDSHDPYMRIPESERKPLPGQRTDLRKLSAWIKMMRELEEAKKRNGNDED